MEIKELRNKFFRECCAKQEDGLQDVNLTPHNTFEWFVKHFEPKKIIAKDFEDEINQKANDDPNIPWNFKK